MGDSRREAFRAYRAFVNAHVFDRAVRFAAIALGIVNLAFVGVDYIAYPEQFGDFLPIRLALTVVLPGIWALAPRLPVVSAFAVTAAGSALLLAVVAQTGGGASDYYAGLLLLVMGVGIFLPFTPKQAAFVAGCMLSAFGLMGLYGGGDSGRFAIHLFFLSGAGCAAILSCALLEAIRFKDFSQRRELELAKDRLEEMDQAKSRFTANVHHELRTPLTLMLAPLEAMRSGDFGELPGRIDETLRTMQTNGLRLLKLINNLLDLAKVESQQLQVRRVRADVRRLAVEVVEGAKPTADRKGITLELDAPAELPVLYADPDALEKVLVNLVGNALKFTDEGGIRVVLEAAEEGGAHLRVVDSGVGIAADELERVFDRFAQIDASATRRHEGTGIGLSLVHELVRLHGGRVWAESEGLGHGSAMHVWLPEGEADAIEDEEVLIATTDGRTLTAARSFEALEGELDLEPQADGRFTEMDRTAERFEGQRGLASAGVEDLPVHPEGTPEVVIAEDNLDMRRLLAFLIGREFVVRPCRNGREALDAVHERAPALVVTDVMMPEMSGTELCRALKGDDATSSVPVMLVTSKAEREMKIEGLELGADDYVTKPFHPRELLARVRSLVRIRELQREVGEQNVMFEASNRELARALRDLKEAEVQLVQSERFAAVGELSAGVAHEVNNPLNFARNSLGALQAYVDDVRGLALAVAGLDLGSPEQLALQVRELEEKKAEIGFDDLADDLGELVSIVTEGLDRTARLVGDLRDFAAPHRGQRSQVNVAKGLRSTLQLLGHRVREVGARVEVEIPDSLPLIEGDPGGLNQVFLNLLKNAAEAIEEGSEGAIHVWAGVEGDAVVVRIRDEGPGMDAGTQERVFEPFFTTKEAGKGTGLGLPMSRRIVEEHGGELSLSSDAGQGTEATVRLPLEPDHEGGLAG